LDIICVLLTIFWAILFARIILSWIPPPISGIGRTLYDLVQDITEPVLKLVRGLDLSPIIVFIAISVIGSALGCRIGLF
jgi:uncharacterized protein YggT (Ycf19 family)